MSPITIYMPENEAKAIKRAARRENRSVSDWARERIKREIHNAWPEDYFEVLGSLRDDSMSRPPQPATSSDTKRRNI